MSFVILRAAKLHTAGEIGGSLGHNFRLMKTPNADPAKRNLNEHDFSYSQIKQNIQARLPEKVRKNGVRVIEYMITASPEWKGWGTAAENDFFDRAKAWLKERHGAENVVGLSIHRDETTPHLVGYIVPIDERGKLNAREFLGGRSKLSAMQTSLAKKVQDLGLERGLEGSKARHTTIKDFYAEIQKPIPEKEIRPIALKRFDGELPKKKTFEGYESYVNRVIDAVFEDAQRQIEEDRQSYLAQLAATNEYYQRELRIEQLKTEKGNTARKRAEDAAFKLTKQVQDLKVDIEELKEKHEEDITEMKKPYALYDHYRNWFPDDVRKIHRYMESEIYKHPQSVYERECERERDREIQLQRQKEREMQLQRQKEHEMELQRQKEREMELQRLKEREMELQRQREREMELQRQREREMELQLERKRQEEQIARAVKNLNLNLEPVVKTQSPKPPSNNDFDGPEF